MATLIIIFFIVIVVVSTIRGDSVEAKQSISEYVAKLQLEDRKQYGDGAYIKHVVKKLKIDGSSAVAQCVLTKGKSKDDIPTKTEVTLQLLKQNDKWAVVSS